MIRRSGRHAARSLAAVFAAALALAALPGEARFQQWLSPTLRVMLNPAAAPDGTLSDAMRARLEALAGAPVMVVGVTRTGALDLAVGGPRDAASLQQLVGRLRTDRSVLWAETSAPRTVTTKSSKAAVGAGRKLMVRFRDDADVAAALPRLAAIAGVPLALERSIGRVAIVGLAQTTSLSQLDAIAKQVESDSAVRYADAVRRVVAHRVPNDPFYQRQWSLGAVNANSAWDLGTGSSSVTVAVVDTGILPHPDLAGRLLAGYDFISDVESARDGDTRDGNPRDEGDWSNDGDCGGFPTQPSFFHGLFVAGQIAANADNNVGIAGVDWAAKILPVRVLGKCGGTFEDVLAGMLWAAGVPVEGAPVNLNPAKVINLSLGGYGSCAAAIQEAVDDTLANGTVIVASAGNESDDAANYAPGNCSGVINVGALSRTGERASYSNYGRRVDVSAPGGDIDADGLILSTHADGDTAPGEFSYDEAMGTSFSAPLVSGTVSLMLARNPNLTAGQILSIVQGSATDFRIGSPCGIGGFCGIGVLDSGTAITSTIPAVTHLPPGAVAIIEYYNGALDHYLITSDPAEIHSLDTFQSQHWQRTGHVFYGWADPSFAPAGVFPRSVCRFHAGPQHGIDSHYFTADAGECAFVIANGAGVWMLQSSAAFWIETPGFNGLCRAGTLPVYRFFNNRRDANHRHTIDLSVRRSLVNRAWVADGKGANGAAMCSLI